MLSDCGTSVKETIPIPWVNLVLSPFWNTTQNPVSSFLLHVTHKACTGATLPRCVLSEAVTSLLPPCLPCSHPGIPDSATLLWPYLESGAPLPYTCPRLPSTCPRLAEPLTPTWTAKNTAVAPLCFRCSSIASSKATDKYKPSTPHRGQRELLVLSLRNEALNKALAWMVEWGGPHTGFYYRCLAQAYGAISILTQSSQRR